MACSTAPKIDFEDLYCQTKHLDSRKLLKTVTGEPIEWESIHDFVVELFWDGPKITNKHEYTAHYRELTRKYHINPSKVTMNYAYKCILQKYHHSELKDKYHRMPIIEKIIQGKTVRSNSGVLVFTVLTSGLKGFKGGNAGCQWDCHYCPNEPGMPRSYLKKEPAVARAYSNEFDGFMQILDRATVLFLQGKHIDKIEIIVEGGTIASYDMDYLREFIRDLYYAFNVFYDIGERRDRLSLEKEMIINESTICKVIGLTLETRPDCINEEQINLFRELGCTRVQIGVQTTHDFILKRINRKCYYVDTIKAIKLLKDCGFKVDIHIMPDLPGSDPKFDIQTFDDLLEEHGLQIDDIKIYPCQTVSYSKIHTWFNNFKDGFRSFVTNEKQLDTYVVKYIQDDSDEIQENWYFTDKSLTNEYINELIQEFMLTVENPDVYYCPYAHDWVERDSITDSNVTKLIDVCKYYKERIPHWIRINRLVRDIPVKDYVKAGLGCANLRQFIMKQMEAEGTRCRCIRCREIKGGELDDIDIDNMIERIRLYEGSDGLEYYISLEDKNTEKLYGFVRLRLSHNPGADILPELKYCALIRELHVYGKMIPAWDLETSTSNHIQHRGFGKCLVMLAEDIASQHGYSKMAIIAGNGVRNYYKNKLGYKLEGTYMTKSLSMCISYIPQQYTLNRLFNESIDEWKLNQWSVAYHLGHYPHGSKLVPDIGQFISTTQLTLTNITDWTQNLNMPLVILLMAMMYFFIKYVLLK